MYQCTEVVARRRAFGSQLAMLLNPPLTFFLFSFFSLPASFSSFTFRLAPGVLPGRAQLSGHGRRVRPRLWGQSPRRLKGRRPASRKGSKKKQEKTYREELKKKGQALATHTLHGTLFMK